MASIFHNLRTERQYKAATALSKEQFEALFSVFQELYIPKNGNPYLPPAPLSDKREALFFILHYLKAYPGLENMALYFGFSQTGVSHYIDLLLPIVKNALYQCAPVKNTLFKNQQAFDQAFANTEEIIIDVTEIAVERPTDKEKQKKLYTGKKKAHTRKWLIITDMFKRILFCSQAFEGSTHDFTMFKSIFSGLDFSRLTVWVDLGFLGIDKQVRAGTLFIAFKASKHQPLDEIALEYNSIISSIRVKIEHAIANLKTFFILRNKNRMRNNVKLNKAFDVCVRLTNFRLNSLTIN